MAPGLFISFRGKDVRHKFVSHLCAALRREQQIRLLIDENFRRGRSISGEIKRAIREAEISVIVFSENYATSEWCLDEVVLILERCVSNGQLVIPVFYRLSKTVVEQQVGSFAAAFAIYKKRNPKKAKKWKAALSKVVDIGGDGHMVLANRPEAKAVDGIVRDVMEKLNCLSSAEVNKGLIGIEWRMHQVKHLLDAASCRICIISICGMGGIGKTKLAEYVYSQVCGQFDGYCVLRNFNEDQLQRKLYCMRNKGYKNVLILLDGVSQPQQIERLAELCDGFGVGSRIIVPTRNRQIFYGFGSKIFELRTYEVDALTYTEASEFLNSVLFSGNLPPNDYMDLLHEVIDYAGGNPLALKELGEFLFDKNGRQQKDALKKLKEISKSEIHDVLVRSYEEIDDEEQTMFLDITYFLKGETREHVTDVLNACGFDGNNGIAALVERSLVSVKGCRLWLHCLHEAMAKEIVRREFPKAAGQRTRLLNHDEVLQMLAGDTGKGAVRGISLDLSNVRDFHLKPDAFSGMFNLIFLKFYDSSCSKGCGDHVSMDALQGLNSLPYDLRLLHWLKYPLLCLPANFDPGHLVELQLPHGNIELLWEGTKYLKNLKLINLSHCQKLMKLPDISKAPRLASIILESCTSIVSLNASVQYLSKLVYFNLKHCVMLGSFPSMISMTSLQTLDLSGCSKLKRLPDTSPSLLVLFLDGTAIKELPPSIEDCSRLAVLSLKNCRKLKSLPRRISKLKSLKELYLSGCPRLYKFPEVSEPMENLEILALDGTAIKEAPENVGMRKLKFLSFHGCSLSEVPSSIFYFTSLECLDLSQNSFSSIPTQVTKLTKLKVFIVSCCEKLRCLPNLPLSLEYLEAHGCLSLDNVSLTLAADSILECNRPLFRFTNCQMLDLYPLVRRHLNTQQELQSAAICFPGSKIPEEVRHHSPGSSLKIQLPSSRLFNSCLRGFVLAAVVDFKDYHDVGGFQLNCRCSLRVGSGDGSSLLGRSFCLWNRRSSPESCPTVIRSQHVFLGYRDFPALSESRGCDIRRTNMMMSFQFCAVDGTGRLLQCCKVLKCGFSLQYANTDGND